MAEVNEEYGSAAPNDGVDMNESDMQDENLECRDCGQQFVFTAGEQEFYKEKGFENKPVRCKACKNEKKARMNGGRDRYESGGYNAGGGGYQAGGGGGYGGASTGTRVCYANQRGECNRGDQCRFSHEGGGGGGGYSSGGFNNGGGGGFGGGGAPGGGGGRVCYAFQKGECNRGEGCRFSHE